MSLPRMLVEPAFRRAVNAAILGDATLSAKLAGKKVYDSFAGQQTTSDPTLVRPMPYIVLGTVVEGPSRTFGATGSDLRAEFHIWSDTMQSKAQAVDIAGDLAYLLDQQPLVLVGHVWVNGEFTITACFPSTIDKAMHLVASYSMVSRNAP